MKRRQVKSVILNRQAEKLSFTGLESLPIDAASHSRGECLDDESGSDEARPRFDEAVSRAFGVVDGSWRTRDLRLWFTGSVNAPLRRRRSAKGGDSRKFSF